MLVNSIHPPAAMKTTPASRPTIRPAGMTFSSNTRIANAAIQKNSYTTNEQKRHQRAATGRYNTELTLAQAHFGGAVHRFSAATDHKLSDAKQPARNYVTFPNTPQTSTRSSRPSANSRRISEKQPNEQAVSQRLARSGLKSRADMRLRRCEV